jgi:hypothetical protein
MRLFKTPWAYLFWLALFLDEIWHELHPRAHAQLPPWHPLFNRIVLTFAETFCFCLIFSLAKLTSDTVERAALAVLAIAFALSIVVDLHALANFHTPLPSFRLVFLVINTLLFLLTAIRFIQVLRERALPGKADPTPLTIPPTNH